MTDAPPPAFVSGKVLILATFAIGLAMAGGAWLYNYRQSDQSAAFWHGAASAIVRGETITLYELGETGGDGPGGRRIVRKFDLTGKPGLLHLRHAFTYDDNFDWGQRRLEQFGKGDDGVHLPEFGPDDWPYAFEFARDGAGEPPVAVWFTRKFDELARQLDAPAGPVLDVLPCPRLGPVVDAYLNKVGVKLDNDAQQRTSEAASDVAEEER